MVKADQGEVAAARGAEEEEADLDRACAACGSVDDACAVCVDDAGGECAACADGADDGYAVRGCARVRGCADPKEGTPSTPPSTPRQRMCPSSEVNR